MGPNPNMASNSNGRSNGRAGNRRTFSRAQLVVKITDISVRPNHDVVADLYLVMAVNDRVMIQKKPVPDFKAAKSLGASAHDEASASGDNYVSPARQALGIAAKKRSVTSNNMREAGASPPQTPTSPTTDCFADEHGWRTVEIMTETIGVARNPYDTFRLSRCGSVSASRGKQLCAFGWAVIIA